MSISSGHQGPLDDEPLFVPDEFEAEHLEQARQMIARRTGVRRVARRLASSMAVQQGGRARRRSSNVILASHGVAILFAIAISAVTGTWLIGVAMTIVIGLSLWPVFRLFHAIERAHAHDLAQRQQPQRRRP